MSIGTFLKEWGLDPSCVDIEAVSRAFLDDMDAGLMVEGGSVLRMIPTYTGSDCRPEPGASVAVVDAGGTNLRTCLVTFGPDGPVISDFVRTPIPGSHGAVSAAEFFDELVRRVGPLLSRTDRLGFCFSYDIQNTPDGDAVPISFSKEVRIEGLKGIRLGATLKEQLVRSGVSGQGLTVRVVNDTVSTLLAGCSRAGAGFDGYVGFILGTGLNIAYVQPTTGIGKIAGQRDLPESMIINTECGEFRCDLGPIDPLLRSMTDGPDIHWLEKMTSGAYLGPLAWLATSKAVEQGLFSAAFAHRFEKVQKLETGDLSALLSQSGCGVLTDCLGGDYSCSDASRLQAIAESVVRRSARLSAAALSATILKSGCGSRPDRPVCVNVDGTTYYRTPGLAECTQATLSGYLTDKKGRYFRLVKIDDSPIVGTAVSTF